MWACADASTKPPEVAAVSGVLASSSLFLPLPAPEPP